MNVRESTPRFVAKRLSAQSKRELKRILIVLLISSGLAAIMTDWSL